MSENFELAAALCFRLGDSIPHDAGLEAAAEEIVDETPDEEGLFRKALELCGEPKTPRQQYLCAKIYARMGKAHAKDVIRCAEAYLASKGWEALDGPVREENGMQIDPGKSRRASLLYDLAAAYEAEGRLKEAYSAYHQAYSLEPYNAAAAVKAADLLVKTRGRKEAFDFLLEQKNNVYYRPVRYRDVFGNIQRNDLFCRQLDAEILKFRNGHFPEVN